MSDYLLRLLSETSSLRCSKHSVLRKVQTCNALISLGISRVSLACFAIRNYCETADAMNDKMVDYRVPVSSILTRSILFKYALHLMLLAFVSNELGPIDQRLELGCC